MTKYINYVSMPTDKLIALLIKERAKTDQMLHQLVKQTQELHKQIDNILRKTQTKPCGD